jgi:hypothetical protein
MSMVTSAFLLTSQQAADSSMQVIVPYHTLWTIPSLCMKLRQFHRVKNGAPLCSPNIADSNKLTIQEPTPLFVEGS